MSLLPTVSNVQREINRVFDGMLGHEDDAMAEWAPRVDVVEHDDRYEITADLPGMKREEIAVSVEGSTLSISGERQRSEERRGDRWYRSERVYGSFRRTFSLPSSVDHKRVSAEYRNGVLNVSLPKAEHAKPRLVDVKTAD